MRWVWKQNRLVADSSRVVAPVAFGMFPARLRTESRCGVYTAIKIIATLIQARQTIIALSSKYQLPGLCHLWQALSVAKPWIKEDSTPGPASEANGVADWVCFMPSDKSTVSFAFN